MNSKRILLTTYHTAFLVPAGGEFELISIADSLKMLGAIADIYGPHSRAIENYDVALHFSVNRDGLELVRAIKAAGKPIVLWPNLWITDVVPEAGVIEEFVSLSKHVVFKSNVEKEHFCKIIPLPEDKFSIVPAGVDPIFAKPAPPSLFRELYGISEKYALCLGIIEPRKNQLTAIKALKHFKLPLILVGRYRDRNYYDICRKEGLNNTIFIDGLPFKSEILRSALQESHIYIEVSKEPPGLSAISAYMAGCNLIINDSEWGREHFCENTTYVDAHSLDSVVSGLELALQRPKTETNMGPFFSRHALPNAIKPLLEILGSVIQ